MKVLLAITLATLATQALAQESFCGRITHLGSPNDLGMRDLVLDTQREVKVVCPVLNTLSTTGKPLNLEQEETVWQFYFENKLKVCFYPEEFSEDLRRFHGCDHAVNKLTRSSLTPKTLSNLQLTENK